MINDKSIAIAIVDTQQHTLAANALFNSISNFPFDQILIYSDSEHPWNGHKINKIETIRSIHEYNKIILKKIACDLKCDYVLIIQYDGFILNPDIFDIDFLKYDYIGAPWNHLSINNIGNGGFSLRSKKLVNIVSEIACIDYSIPEDVFICQQLRSLDEFKEIRFAPIETARIFSFEYPAPSFKTFGFHGVFNLPMVYRNNLNYLINNISDACLASKYDYLYPFINSISRSHGEIIMDRFMKLKGN